jgi:hypothetical protein
MRSVLFLVMLAALLSACGTCDTRGQQPIEYRGGNADLASDVPWYETSSAGGEYLHFPAGRRFDLIHGLGRAPEKFTSYVSFERVPGSVDDSGKENTGNFAESSGNMVVYECLDEERVRVRNDTCAEFYLRVVLEAPGNSSPGMRDCR